MSGSNHIPMPNRMDVQPVNMGLDLAIDAAEKEPTATGGVI